MGGHGEVSGQSLFQAGLHRVEDRGSAVAVMKEDAATRIHAAYGGSRHNARQWGVALHSLEQRRTFRSDIPNTQRPVAVQLPLQLERELLGEGRAKVRRGSRAGLQGEIPCQ